MRHSSRPDLLLILPVLFAAAFGALNLTGVYRIAENRVYDQLLHLRPAVPEQELILMLDIDDQAIEQVGVFPWSRDIMADGLILMREFGAGTVVFDIEYTEESPLGVNSAVLTQEMPERFHQEFAAIQQNVGNLFRAIQTGMISPLDAEDYIRDLSSLTSASRDRLLAGVREIARDNDRYLGQAARLFGRAFFTVRMLPEGAETVSDELKALVAEKAALKSVTGSGRASFSPGAIRPAILPILQGARGAGFPNVGVDADGVLRRVDLILEYEGRPYPQLAFGPLLDRLGSPEVEYREQEILLRGARLPGGGSRDIRIPLAEDGKMLLNWPKSSYLDSYRHMSYYELVANRRLEESLLHNLEIMEEAGYFTYGEGAAGLLAPYRYARGLLDEVLAGGDPVRMEEYREARTVFFADADRFLGGGAETALLGALDEALGSDEVPEAVKGEYRSIREQVPPLFSASRQILKDLARSRARLAGHLQGAFCIIGLIGTSTSDIGVTPFAEEYMNVGTHATVANTILSGVFLDDLPWWYAAVLALALALGVALLIRRLSPLRAVLAGFGYLVLAGAAGVAFFLITGIYLNLLTPTLSVFFTFLSITLAQFLRTADEKNRIRSTFNEYLSPDVIKEILEDPSKGELGGVKKQMTAVFTDVRGFSTISETLDPSDLVRLLNEYLTQMSDIILDLRGTIDKYEGDAIIAFFGAPVAFPGHAANACLAAVRMKKMEQFMNDHLVQQGLAPGPLLTRIGINTGEMVVGNMGTARKKNYTIMGNAVNLAARLEGVNKKYRTWTLISESTFQEGGAAFTARRMDRVRVVGIEKPVRLYELLDEKSATEPDLREGVEAFHRALELFERKEWERARKGFQEVLKILPDDGPSSTFLERLDEFRRTPPPESWDGVFKLSEK